MHVVRLAAALMLGALLGETLIAPMVVALTPLFVDAPRAAVVATPLLIGLVGVLIALLVTPAASERPAP